MKDLEQNIKSKKINNMKKLIGLLVVIFITGTNFVNGQYDIVITHNDNPTDVQTLDNVIFAQNYYPSNAIVFEHLTYYNHTVTVFDNGFPEELDTVYLQNGALYISVKTGTDHTFRTKISNNTGTLNTEILSYIEFTIYPNPTTDYINLSTETDAIIYDLYGNKVLEATSKQIDVKHLPKGMYIINVNNNKQLINKQ